jgi:acyl dehydratase
MKPPVLPKRIVETRKLGKIVGFTSTITEANVSIFSGVTWDIDPYHTDDTFIAYNPTNAWKSQKKSQ